MTPSTSLPPPNGPFVFHEYTTSILDEPFTICIVTLYLVIGISLIACGYRYIRWSLFSSGFSAGSAVIYCICIHESMFPANGGDDLGVFANPTVRLSTVTAICVSAGVLFGLINTLIELVGLIVLGFQTGVLVGAASLAAYDVLAVVHPPITYWYCFTILLTSGFFGAATIFYWKIGLTIACTSIYGAAMVAACVDYCLERCAMVYWMYDRARLVPYVEPECVWSWAALAAWPAVAALGVLLQTLCCGGGGGRRRQGRPALALTREQRAELRQRRYRYFYQVRTAHGDVISQSFVQALHQKSAASDPWGGGGGGAAGAGVCAGAGSSTLQSDSTHLTALASDGHNEHDSDDDRRVHYLDFH